MVEPVVTQDSNVEAEFERFVIESDSRLRRAIAAHVPVSSVEDALAEALAFAFEHWHRVGEMEFPVAYLVRVSRSRVRQRKQWPLPEAPTSIDERLVEPALVHAMHSLSTRQRAAVWLVHGCGWSYAEAGEALGVSRSAIGSHVERGLRNLRRRVGA